jgi:hypothetical protein
MSSESDERGGRAGRRRRLPRSWRKGALRGGSSHVIRGKATQRHTEPEARLETGWAQCMRHARARLKKARAPIAKSTSVLRETIVVLVLWPPHRSLAHPECWNSHARPASESSSYMARTHLECEPRRRCRRTRRARRHRRGRNHRRRAGRSRSAPPHLHRLLWVLSRHAGADEDEALHLPLRLHRADLVRVDDVRDLASSAYLETLA